MPKLVAACFFQVVSMHTVVREEQAGAVHGQKSPILGESFASSALVVFVVLPRLLLHRSEQVEVSVLLPCIQIT